MEKSGFALMGLRLQLRQHEQASFETSRRADWPARAQFKNAVLNEA
jgi:hypothetical protein